MGPSQPKTAADFLAEGMMAGFPAAYFASRRSPKRTKTEELKKFDVPTLIIQGDDDQIVPFADAGEFQSKLIKGATLKVYKGAARPVYDTKNEVSADLLAFAGRKEGRKAA